MQLRPYINFNGNCAEAIKFYEKVFNTKAEGTCVYSDIPKDAGMEVPKGKENWIMHSGMKIADGVEIQMSDCPDMGPNVGANICLQLTYDKPEEVRKIFAALEKGGKILCPPTVTFYSPLYSELIDKFGIRWSIMLPIN